MKKYWLIGNLCYLLGLLDTLSPCQANPFHDAPARDMPCKPRGGGGKGGVVSGTPTLTHSPPHVAYIRLGLTPHFSTTRLYWN